MLKFLANKYTKQNFTDLVKDLQEASHRANAITLDLIFNDYGVVTDADTNDFTTTRSGNEVTVGTGVAFLEQALMAEISEITSFKKNIVKSVFKNNKIYVLLHDQSIDNGKPEIKISSDFGDTWYDVPISTNIVDGSGDIVSAGPDVQITNHKFSMAVSSSTIYISDGYSGIFRTTDEGQSAWEALPTQTSLDALVTHIREIEIFGDYLIAAAWNALPDGGTTIINPIIAHWIHSSDLTDWASNAFTPGLATVNHTGGVFKFEYANATTGYLTYGWYEDSGSTESGIATFKSTNSGRTWTSITEPTTGIDNQNLIITRFMVNGEGFVAWYDTAETEWYMHISSDYFATYSTAIKLPNDTYTSGYIKDGRIFLSTSTGKLYVSVDSGENWNAPTSAEKTLHFHLVDGDYIAFSEDTSRDARCYRMIGSGNPIIDVQNPIVETFDSLEISDTYYVRLRHKYKETLPTDITGQYPGGPTGSKDNTLLIDSYELVMENFAKELGDNSIDLYTIDTDGSGDLTGSFTDIRSYATIDTDLFQKATDALYGAVRLAQPGEVSDTISNIDDVVTLEWIDNGVPTDFLKNPWNVTSLSKNTASYSEKGVSTNLTVTVNWDYGTAQKANAPTQAVSWWSDNGGATKTYFTDASVTVNATNAVINTGNRTVSTTITVYTEETSNPNTVNSETNATTAVFVDAMYYGAESAGQTPDTLSGLLTKQIQNESTWSFSVSPSNERIIIMYPTSYGALSDIQLLNTGSVLGLFTSSTGNISAPSGTVGYTKYELNNDTSASGTYTVYF